MWCYLINSPLSLFPVENEFDLRWLQLPMAALMSLLSPTVGTLTNAAIRLAVYPLPLTHKRLVLGL